MQGFMHREKASAGCIQRDFEGHWYMTLSSAREGLYMVDGCVSLLSTVFVLLLHQKRAVLVWNENERKKK
jgi:hypothetical protein